MMEGEVSAVRALEFGADMKLSEVTKRSLGDTVPMELPPPAAGKSKLVGIAGDEKAVWPPSKAVKSSKSTSGVCK